MTYIGIELIGDADEVFTMLDRLDSVFSSTGMSRFMKTDVVPYLQERARMRFSSEGDLASGKWLQLAETTVSIRDEGVASGEFIHGGAHPINRRTDLMYDYITEGVGDITLEGNGNVSLHYPKRSAPGGEMTQKVRRAQAGDGKAPARPVLAVSEADVGFIVSKLAYFIQGYDVV